MVGLPPIVIVQSGDEDAPGIAADPQQVVEARVPRAGRALRTAVAKEVHDDARGPPCPNRLPGLFGGGVVACVIDDDDPPGRSRLTFDGGKSPARQHIRAMCRGDQYRHAECIGRVHDVSRMMEWLETPSSSPGAEERGATPPHRGFPHPGSPAALLHRPSQWKGATELSVATGHRARSVHRPAPVSLHYNPDGPDCARQATRTSHMEWLGGIERRTEVPPPLVEVAAIEIVGVDTKGTKTLTGIETDRKVRLRMPLSFSYGRILCHSRFEEWPEGMRRDATETHVTSQRS